MRRGAGAWRGAARIGGLVLRWGGALPGSEVWYRDGAGRWRDRRFGTARRRNAGEIAQFGIFSWRDLRFGTHRWANLEVWYPQKPLGQIATRHFFEAKEPNRQSWQKSGYQTSISARDGRKSAPSGTKSPIITDLKPASGEPRDRATRMRAVTEGRRGPSPGADRPPGYSSLMMRAVRAAHSALARSISMVGHSPAR